MRHHHGPHCGCPKQIVYPVTEDCVHHCTESVIEHVHPGHTTIMNHHLVKNKHVFPHSTSVANTCNSVDVYGGAFQEPVPPYSYGAQKHAAGMMTPEAQGMGNHMAGTMPPMNHGHLGMGHGPQAPGHMHHC